ncbi:protein ABHD14B [Aplysia californica]|uniref:Protein ABHD14B n=1 Tax=Aplysia californica TaxID=6500 RepID=A0ABM0ZUU1_APLCA|nr:protein ABHD14B [Aplysia californica]
MAQNGDDRTMNLGPLDPPPELTEETQAALKHESREVEVDLSGKKVKIYLEEVTPANGAPTLDVLLVHSGTCSSADWVKIRTVYHLANWGYRAVAIDLPGKGKSPSAIDKNLFGDFVSALVDSLTLKNAVFITPSSGGRYTQPYLFNNPATSTERAVGFVPIAPADTGLYAPKFKDSQVPTLILYGSKDPRGPTSQNDLVGLTNHKIAVLEDADHACYLEKPDEFHKVLYNWLKDLRK